MNPNLPISQVVEIMPVCADMETRLPPPLFSSVSPGPGREGRNGIGWSLMEKTARSGVGCSGVPWQGAVHFLHLLHLQVGFGRDLSLQLGRSSHFLRVLAHGRMGKARLSGHNLESGVGHC